MFIRSVRTLYLLGICWGEKKYFYLPGVGLVPWKLSVMHRCKLSWFSINTHLWACWFLAGFLLFIGWL